jgi:hypothetical protein
MTKLFSIPIPIPILENPRRKVRELTLFWTGEREDDKKLYNISYFWSYDRGRKTLKRGYIPLSKTLKGAESND